MDNTIIKQAKELKIKHKGESFNINYASKDIIKKVADNFINKKIINVDSIKSINKIIQYMISAKMVGDTYFYNKLNDYTDNLLDSFCEDIHVEDHCYDTFDRAVERHLYRENSVIYEYLKSKHVRYLDAGLVKFKNNYDIFLPEYNAIIDVSAYKAEQNVKTLIETSEKENDSSNRFELRNVRNFVYYKNKLRCTNVEGDPVNIHNADITEYIIDSSTDFKDIRESNFLLEGCGNGRGRVSTSRKIKVDQLKEGDEVFIKDGLIYHNIDKQEYTIVGPFELMHFRKYDDYNNMSLVYEFNSNSNKSLVDLIKLRNLSCDTITLADWEDDHDKNELVQGCIHLTLGRTPIARIQSKEITNNINIEFNDIIELLDQI